MTLHVKTTTTIYGTVVVPKWCEPDEVYVINGGRPCKATQVWRIEGGKPCKVWPTPVATHLSTVTSATMDGFHWMGAPHAHTGQFETYSVTLGYGGRLYGTAFVGQTYFTSPAGTVIIEARKGTGRWVEVGRRAVTGTETRGKVEVHGRWPASTGTWQFRARFVATDHDRYLDSTGPERTAPIVVEKGTPSTGSVTAKPTATAITTVTGAGARSMLGTHSQNVIGARLTVKGTVKTTGFGATGTGINGTVQVQWKLEGEGANKWSNFGSPATVMNGVWTKNQVFGAAGHPDLRAVFTPATPATYNPSTSRPALLGVFAPGKVGALHKTSGTSTSVAFSWGRVAHAQGYGVVKSGSASLVKRTTGTNSGNIRASGGQGFKVRAYATDRLGHRWYGPASDSYIYLTSNKTFKKSTFQLGGGIFESQPPNP